ncbi:MAG: hypothetical protein OSA06_06215 [Acidimicrobiales bacterium]|jgi:hypothetical protein|nr:hypothetical protein [Acidimicrobiales bacterium]
MKKLTHLITVMVVLASSLMMTPQTVSAISIEPYIPIAAPVVTGSVDVNFITALDGHCEGEPTGAVVSIENNTTTNRWVAASFDVGFDGIVEAWQPVGAPTIFELLAPGDHAIYGFSAPAGSFGALISVYVAEHSYDADNALREGADFTRFIRKYCPDPDPITPGNTPEDTPEDKPEDTPEDTPEDKPEDTTTEEVEESEVDEALPGSPLFTG